MRVRGFLALAPWLAACGTAPPPRERPRPAPIPPPVAPQKDPCEPEAGKPPVPLAKTFSGVLAPARCQAEVLQIMQGVSRALGVGCDHCHDEGDYSAPSEPKRVANWMATELIPRLAKRAGGSIGCADCHVEDGQGKAKILGDRRQKQRAVEWMTTVLVERFDAANGSPLYCKTCHGGPLGSPGFRGRVILTDHLPALPRGNAAAPPVEARDGGSE